MSTPDNQERRGSPSQPAQKAGEGLPPPLFVVRRDYMPVSGDIHEATELDAALWRYRALGVITKRHITVLGRYDAGWLVGKNFPDRESTPDMYDEAISGLPKTRAFWVRDFEVYSKMLERGLPAAVVAVFDDENTTKANQDNMDIMRAKGRKHPSQPRDAHGAIFRTYNLDTAYQLQSGLRGMLRNTHEGDTAIVYGGAYTHESNPQPATRVAELHQLQIEEQFAAENIAEIYALREQR